MEKLEKDSSKYLDKEFPLILEKIDEICDQYRKANVNKKIEEVDEWNISDFFDVNDLERIKQTPEYIVEKILIKFKDFINLNGYFFIMKPHDNLKNLIENKISGKKKKNEKEEKELEKENKNEENEKKSEKKRGKKSIEKKNNEKEKNKKIKKKKENKKEEDKTKEKNNNEKKGEKNKELLEQKKYKEEMKNESEKKYNIKNNKEKHSNSMDKKIPNHLNIHSEGEKEFSYNTLFHKYDINNNVLDKESFLNNSDSKKHNRLLNREKEYNNNKKNSLSSSKNEFERNTSNFSSIKDNLSTNKSIFNINSIEFSSNINNSSSKSKNILENNSCNFSSKNNTSTFYYFPYSYSISSINEEENKNKKKDEKKKENMDTYKLRFFKNKLNLEEGEILSGNSYEEYARKTIKLMFILSIKKVPIFYNPQKIVTDSIIDFYKSQIKLGVINKIDTPIDSSIFEQTKKDKHFEIDIVVELKKNEIIKFIEKFSNKIYFENHFLKKEDKDTKEKVTCYMEIARNLISQGKEKLGQIKKYIKIIKIMNNLRLFVSNMDKYKELLIPYKSSDSTEKIFSIITDGNYEELNFVISEIVIPNFLNPNLNELDIKNNIKNKLNEKPKLFDNIENKDSLIDNIYYVLEIFYHLKVNTIKFCLIYIGEICESTCGLGNILEKLKNLECLNKKGMELNEYTIKKRNNLEELKNKYHEIKKIIHEFEKKCENNIVFNKKIIDNIFDKFDFNIFDFDSFISQIKIECKTYIFGKINDKESKDIIISIFKKFFKFYTKYSQSNREILRKIFEFSKQDKHTIYFLIFYGNFPDYFVSLLSHYKNENIFTFQINNEKNNEIIKFFPDDLIKQINIESKIKDKLQEEIKRNQPLFSKEKMLMPNDLEYKLTQDLNMIFKINGILNLKEILNEIKFDIPEKSKKELIEYLYKISDKLEIKKIDLLEIEKVFKTNLDKLIKNILSRHFYDIFIYKIGKHFKKKFEEELMKSIKLCNKS